MKNIYLNKIQTNKKKSILLFFLLIIIIFFIWQSLKKPPIEGNWQKHLTRLSTAQFNGDLVTVKNVRNFRYNGSETEKDMIPDYYDKTYNLNKLTKVWYITEPFANFRIAAHTFLSFEFENGIFLTISIEARKSVGQDYNIYKGLISTYPLMYIAADERDTVFVRANVRKSDVYAYPVKLSSQEKGRALLVDMLETMNDLVINPQWYNTVTSNCTSKIADHVKKISPERLPLVLWQSAASGYADKLALEQGLIDTDLSLEEARKKYRITDKSQEIGYVEDYSKLIRQFHKD